MDKTFDNKMNMEEMVYSKIKSSIYKKYIRPGSQLVETKIADQLGVSRTPVRGAIRRLTSEGYVQNIPNRGAFLIKPTLEEIISVYSVRIQLERMAAKLAAQNISSAYIKRLYDLVEEEKQIFDLRDPSSYYKVNDSFHSIISEATQNHVLHYYVMDIVNRASIYSILFEPLHKTEINQSEEEHLEIAKALEKRDPKQAEDAMVNHLVSSLEAMKLEGEKIVPPDDFLFL